MEIEQIKEAELLRDEVKLLKKSTEIQIAGFKALRGFYEMEGLNLVNYAFFRYEKNGETIIRHMTRENYNLMTS